MICGKYIVVSPKIIVNIIAIVFLLFKKKIEIICPKIAPTNDIIIIVTAPLGVLSKISMLISSIFCTIAVDIARKAAIGRSSRIYFLMTHPILGITCLIVCINGLDSKRISYFINSVNIVEIPSNAISARNQSIPRLVNTTNPKKLHNRIPDRIAIFTIPLIFASP